MSILYSQLIEYHDSWWPWKPGRQDISSHGIELQFMQYSWHHIDGLGQEKRNSIALAMELRFSCTNPSIWEESTLFN